MYFDTYIYYYEAEQVLKKSKSNHTRNGFRLFSLVFSSTFLKSKRFLLSQRQFQSDLEQYPGNTTPQSYNLRKNSIDKNTNQL